MKLDRPAERRLRNDECRRIIMPREDLLRRVLAREVTELRQMTVPPARTTEK